VRGPVHKRSTALVSTAAVLASVFAGTALATTGPAPYAIVNVRLTDQRITLSKAGVHDVTYVDFIVRNVGKLSHNFRIGGLASKSARPGQTVHLVVAFPAYGTYRYSCSLKCTRTMSGSFQVDRPLPPG
jgi:plastocyanin